MKPDIFLREVVDPSLKKLAAWTGTKSDDRARVLLMAIAGQESDWRYRRQSGGPARSYWQFERFGGVAEIMQKCPSQLAAVCGSLDIPVESALIFEAMTWNDTLAVAMARLLLWQDPAALPGLGQRDEGWHYYERNWRPGLPHPDKWPACYRTAMELVSMEKPL
jgi:hypothetical protein